MTRFRPLSNSSGIHAIQFNESKLPVLTSLIFFLSSFINAQDNYNIRTFTTENGLPHNTVLSIAQDKTGFLWIGTWDGLSRYDGYEFHNYYHDPEDSTSITNFNIGKVRVDRRNNVWLFSLSNRLSRYLRAADKFLNYTTRNDSVLSRTGVGDMEIDPDGDLLIAGEGGIAMYDYDTEHFKYIKLYDQQGNCIQKLGAFEFSFDNSGSIWIFINNRYLQGSLIHRDSSAYISITKSYESFRTENLLLPIGYKFNWHFLVTANQVPWLITGIGCIRADTVRQSFREVVEHPDGIFRHKGNTMYWFQEEDAIKIITDSGKELEIKLGPDEYVQAVFADNEQTIWYGTLTSSGFGTGLHRYAMTQQYFKHYFGGTDDKPTVVYALMKDGSGDLWAGIQGQSYVTRLTGDGRTIRINQLNAGQMMASFHPRAILPVPGGVWLGYMRSRLDFYNLSTGKVDDVFLNETTRHDELPFGFRTLCCDTSNRLLVGTIGIFLYTPSAIKPFRKIWQDNSGVNVFCIKADSSGEYWAGCSLSKLLKISHDLKHVETYVISETEYNIEDICFGENRTLWLALLGGGIVRFDPVSGKKEFFTTADGLSNNTTYGILKDHRGNLWISTNNGISRFNTSTNQFRIFGPTDGLRIHEFNADAAYLADDGEMFFGGMGGAVSFYPDSINDAENEERIFPLVITEFMVSGSIRYFDKPVNDLDKAVLNKGDDNFSVTYASLNLKNPDKVLYRYRLLGYRNTWQETDHLHRSVNFTGLSPGNYRFELEASDRNGVWSASTSLSIVIPPFYYQTVWFRMAIILLGICVVGLLIILYNRQIRIKEKQKQDHLRLESLRSQMNPHFVFNSLNSINYFISKSDRLSANRYIASFSKLIRSILNHMSHEFIDLSDEIASLQDYLKLEFLRFGDKFDYSINAPESDVIAQWEVFPGMVQPFIENAVWHGVRGLEDRKGYINIVFRFIDAGHLQCLILDDGIGRSNSKKADNLFMGKKSRGIAMVMERLQILNDLKKSSFTILIEDLYPDREECGTRVILDLPVRRKVSS
jgi:ligand-binding sensor domain-containing protein